MNFTINGHSYSFVYNQLNSNTEELHLLVVVKAMDISRVLQSAYRTIANLSQSLSHKCAVSEVKKQLIYNIASQIKTVLFDLLPNLLNNLTELIDEKIHFNDQNIVESVIKSVRKEMKRINVHFEFWQEEGTISWKYTSLMGGDKLKTFVKELYYPADIIPYIHVLVYYVAEFKDMYANSGKKEVKKAAILEIMDYDTRNLYFYTHNIPTFFEKDTRLMIQLH
ncbi:8723_t:CDS:2 [Gigaspora margarita]|uniref:8723_t:CDS:1 n=1 Tax=Gigaspora margarita TaxID=4874 RepID=A0ABN7VM04_GIGMA|nr:8723_t:CDS:2 [Gigaspora margarita]